MGAIVYAATGPHAETYHFDSKCGSFHAAQIMNDWDCWDDHLCTHKHPFLGSLKRMSDDRATADLRLWPCRYCVPAHLRKYPPSEDFGHKPITGEDGRTLCARCATHVRRFRWDGDGETITGHTFLPVRWPCTSAIVLGLVPRPEGVEA